MWYVLCDFCGPAMHLEPGVRTTDFVSSSVISPRHTHTHTRQRSSCGNAKVWTRDKLRRAEDTMSDRNISQTDRGIDLRACSCGPHHASRESPRHSCTFSARFLFPLEKKLKPTRTTADAAAAVHVSRIEGIIRPERPLAAQATPRELL